MRLTAGSEQRRKLSIPLRRVCVKDIELYKILCRKSEWDRRS
nr:MAG TPA: hypothetical protein [Caudoviricetes sp.]DAO71837.1 MAG TPA: hypothetical protein [Caudoviricetes sp.]